MSALRKYYILETIYAFALSFTKATFVLFFLDHELSRFEIGMVFGIFNITVMVAEPLTAAYGELFGRKKSLLIGCFLKGITACLFVFGSTFSHFLIAEIVSGIAMTFISGCLMAWLVDALKEEKTNRRLYDVFAQAKKLKYAAFVVGGLLGAYFGDVSLDIPWIANGLFFSIFFILVATVIKSDATVKRPTEVVEIRKVWSGYLTVLRDPGIAFLIFTSFVSSFALASIQLFWLPSVKEAFSTSSAFLGWLWVGIAGANFLGAHFVKPYVARFTHKLDSLASIAFFSSLVLFSMIYTWATPWTFLFYFLFEAGKPIFSTVKNDLINLQIASSERVTVLSLHSLSMKLGTTLGLIIVGFLSDLWGLQNAWYVAAGIFFLNTFIYVLIQTWMLSRPEKRELLRT